MSARAAHRLVWLVALLPSLIFLAHLDAAAVNSASGALNAAGRLTGVAGLSMLLLAAILSARVPGFDRPFGGLTRLWRTHHLLGAWSLILLLLHPVLLALAAAEVSISAAAATLLPPPSDLAGWSGWAALILMMIFLAPSFSFFGPPRYERWKKVHRLAGPAVALALVHDFWLSRGLPQWLDLALWSTLALLALAAVGWRFVFSRRIGRLAYTVSDVTAIANNVVELSLEPGGRKLRHEAGNFVYLTLEDDALEAGRGEEHPYTLSSSPDEKRLRVAIKSLGDASRAAQTVRPGTKARVEGPYGRFFLSPDRVGEPELWVAGGIGVTPFIARMRHLSRRGEAADVCMIFCVQDPAREIFTTELHELAARLEGFSLHIHYFYREGPLSGGYLDNVCPDLGRRSIYICGPQPLNALVQQQAAAAGVPASRIHTEEFELL
ncbi:MAG: oxidoreductase [Gammaproteobacteria bacterium]|jgi:predicted ferric reductase|nr:oxidoreductase [Gammaproteobacteria bacterium]